MTVTLDLPPDVEQAYNAEAQAKGVPFDDLVREVLIARQPRPVSSDSVIEQGLGLLGSPEDAALLDEAVAIAYEERRRPTGPSGVL
jgi:tRNA(fMet)-specific endonuclease VapC